VLDSAWYILKEFIGINDAMNCFGGDMWACGSLILGAIPVGKILKTPKVAKAISRTIDAIQARRAAKRAAEAVLAAARAAETAALNAKKLAIERAKQAAQAAKKKAVDKVNATSNKATNASKKTGNPVQKDAQAKTNPKGSSAGSSGAGKSGGGRGDSKPGGKAGASERSNGGSSGGSCKTPGNSFVPGTKVVMADGSAKPIEDVKPGDKVQVTDPETGRVEVETVTAAITGEGVKHLVKVTIDTDGEQGSDTAEVTATDGHPFWVPELNEWVDATDLRSGQMLRTSAGTLVQITAIERWSTAWATVHNLTVANIHTYYVLAGTTPVLVHNCGEVEYGSTDLSVEVIKNRLEEGSQLHNGAAARYLDADGNEQIAVAFSGGGKGRKFHAEQKLIARLGKENILEMYSELRPCSGKGASCSASFGGIKQSWSWEWTTSAASAASGKDQANAIKTVFAEAAAGIW
ncbi:polymorphic toxin-type HINT domain-containing protein, partial [Micromonospora taraxaci]